VTVKPAKMSAKAAAAVKPVKAKTAPVKPAPTKTAPAKLERASGRAATARPAAARRTLKVGPGQLPNSQQICLPHHRMLLYPIIESST
jgi:hypothetical protein